jgi:hypothetical protein
MADLAITAANFKPSNLALKKKGTAAAAITRGQPVYYSPADAGYKQANVSALGGASIAGIACEDVGAGQDFLFVIADPKLNLGAAGLASGDTLWASATGITKTFADLVSTWAGWVLGMVNGDGTVNLSIVGGGVKP